MPIWNRFRSKIVSVESVLGYFHYSSPAFPLNLTLTSSIQYEANPIYFKLFDLAKLLFATSKSSQTAFWERRTLVDYSWKWGFDLQF